MKLNVALCKTCVDFKQQRDFFRGKCLDYEKQIAEKDKLLENVQNELAQVKEMSRNTSSDSQKAIHTPDENQTNNVQIVENEELPLDKVADSPVIPRMRLSKIRKDSEMNSGDQWQLVVPKTEPPDEMDDSSDEDSLPLSKYLAIKMEPEVVLEEGEFNADRDSNEEMDVDMIPENEANTKDLMPLNQRPRYQICRWKIGTDANTAKACGKVCLGTELVSHITTEHMDNMDTLHNNVCMWDYCERYSRQFKLRGDLLRHLYYHIAKANQRCLVDNCGKTFFHKLDLEKHKLSHACGETTSDNKYACTHEGCDKRVMSIEHLRQHLLTHAERDIPCTYPGCNKLFKSTTTLDVHCRKFHIGVEKVTEKESKTSAPVTVFPNKPNSCCVEGCSSTSETPKITLHYFPKNPKLRKVWISKLKATKNFTCINRVCSEHFLPSDYYVNRNDQKRRLKPNSVPSLCLPTQTADEESPRNYSVSRTVGDKLKLLGDLRTLYDNNLHEAERATGVGRKLWRYWLKQESTWLDMDHMRERRRIEGGGRKMLHPKLDAAMLDWFTEERRQNRAVTFQMFRKQALNVVGPNLKIDLGSFKCSNRYIRAFIHRNKLSVPMCADMTPEDNRPPERLNETP